MIMLYDVTMDVPNRDDIVHLCDEILLVSFSLKSWPKLMRS